MTLDEWYSLKPGNYIRFRTPKSRPRRVFRNVKGTVWLDGVHKDTVMTTYDTGYRKKFDKVI